ncbi:MAG: hypothetical protein ACKOE6_15990 [Flammeovirgaceae bacterium]
MKQFLLFVALLYSGTALSQTLDDGLMMPKKYFCTGFLYTYSQWNNYWEGTLKRDNQNIGTLSSHNIMYVGNYGINDKLNIIAMAPYISNQSNKGTLTGLQGVQDLTLGGKYRLVRKQWRDNRLSVFGVATVSTPLSNYSVDLLPMSVGMGSTTASLRGIVNYRWKQGWYLNFSPAYSYRGNVTLDRNHYFTDGVAYYTNQVRMFDQLSYNVNFGLIKQGLQTELNFYQQNTLGGGDIRRQEMPFVSNRMNASTIGLLVMYYLPAPKYLAFRFSTSYVIDGRNVGQSFSVMGGLLYTIHFTKPNSTVNEN